MVRGICASLDSGAGLVLMVKARLQEPTQLGIAHSPLLGDQRPGSRAFSFAVPAPEGHGNTALSAISVCPLACGGTINKPDQFTRRADPTGRDRAITG
jgi:hypothetical protein